MGNEVSYCVPNESDLGVRGLQSFRGAPVSANGATKHVLHSTAPQFTRSGDLKLPKDHLTLYPNPVDRGTPDEWVPRDPKLIRLTGSHPFNCEPPVHELFDQGFITPVSLHYVRSHGRVPQLAWETHKVKVCGLVANPREFTMDEIEAMPTVSMPVTLTCAGNRRKEYNMVKKTRGFNWGAAATSTGVWTGVRLTYLLELCGVDLNRALHVRFEGSKKEELPPSTFGASVDIATAMSAFSDIIIAYLHNGKRLHPDHGYPVRVIIPGWVGARMVKWLDTIEVSMKVSESHYHYFDNRIFPSFVDNELAEKEGWWYKERYVFNELNVNSVIIHPQDSTVLLGKPGDTYNVCGYAYSGGGRKITRVEISLDAGKTWRLTELDFPEEKYSHAPKYGFYYCWMFWNVDVPVDDILESTKGASEIRVRAWDTSNNTQPADIIWNLMGYGNNCQYTVKIETALSAGSVHILKFSHPTVAGASTNGWMKKPEEISNETSETSTITSGENSSSSPTSVAVYTKEEVSKHNSRESAWIIVDGKVYDCTRYLDEHPGGAASILLTAGQDASDEFNDIHSQHAKQMLADYEIGVLEGYGAVNFSEAQASEPEHALKSDEWLDFELISREEISSDTRLFKFKLPNPDQSLGLPVGGHVLARAVVDGKPVMRAYTPITTNDSKGNFILCIKVYFPSQKFPEGGKLSQYMENMTIGDTLKFNGPLGKVQYDGNGKFLINNQERHFTQVAFVCGGTGITPAYQIMSEIAKNREDKTTVSLLYGNKTEDDILLRKELDAMVKKRPESINVRYTLDTAPPGWKFSRGYVTEQMMVRHLPKPTSSTLFLVCGPPAMVDKVVIALATKIGFDTENIHKL